MKRLGWLLLCLPLAVQAEPQRLVSLAPHLSAWVMALGAGARLRGAILPLPPGSHATAVGDANGLNRERLLALQPDGILTWPGGNRADDLAWIARHAWPSFSLDSRNRLADFPAQLRQLGDWLGTPASAATLAQQWTTQLARLQQRHAQARPVTVFYQIWPDPLLTLNDQHILGDALRICGGQNVFGALPLLAPQVSWEAVLAADPELVLIAQESGQDFAQLSAPWQRFPQLQAVRHRRVHAVNADQLHQPGPALLAGVAQLCATLAQARTVP